jgi:hypothetical protein
MGNLILFNILKFLDFIIITFSSIFLIIIILVFLLKKINIKSKRIALFGLFLNLNKRSVLMLSISFTRYLYIIYSVLLCDRISEVNLTVLLILTVLYNGINFDIKGLLFDLINNLIIYFALVSCNILITYIFDVNLDYYLLTLLILLGVFIINYASYFFIKGMNDVLKRTKIVKEKNHYMPVLVKQEF